MLIKEYNKLTNEARSIREIVFVDEQGFQEEFDSVDEFAPSLVMYDNDKAVATCRYFKLENDTAYLIGRIAVLKEYRGKGLGAMIIRSAEERILKLGVSKVLIHAQCRSKEFYEKCGYECFGDIDYEEDCPHIWMKKIL